MDKQVRSEKIVSSFRNGRTLRRAGRLERVRNGKRLVFTSEPDYLQNSAGEIIGVDAWVELYDEYGNEIPIDPHRRIINPPTVPRSNITENVSGELTVLEIGDEDPFEAFIEAVWDSVEETPYPEGWRTAGTVTTIYGDTSDGRLEGQGATYNVARQGTGTVAIDTTGTASATGQFFSSTYSCYQQYWAFDTSIIDDDDIVTGVSLELYQTGQNLAGGNFTVEARAFDWGATLTTADYRPGNTLSSYTLLASIATSGMGTLNRYYALTSTAAFLTVDGLKTGMVRLFTSSSKQRTGTTPTDREFVQFATANASGTTTDPKLVITHDTPGPIQFVGASHSDTLSGSLPPGTQEGDILLAVVQADRSPTGPTGWTKIGADRTANDFTANVWYIVRGASPPALNWGGGGSSPALDIVAYRGAATTPHVSAQSSAGSGVAPSVITSVPDAVLVCLNADYSGANPPSGMTDRTVNVTYNRIADLAVPTPGATGTKSFTGGDPIGTWSVVLAPAGDSEEHSGGSETSTSHTVGGSGRPGFSRGSTTSITVSSSAGGSPGLTGGSSTAVVVVEQGAGSAGMAGGSVTSVTISSSGMGSAGFSGGSNSDVSISVSSEGSPGTQNGSDVSVTVTATGGGTSSTEASGGSTAVVLVDVSGSGSAAFSGGSGAVVETVSTGAGRRVIVDITVIVGPSKVLAHYEIGESRTSYIVGDNRLALSAGGNHLRERVQVDSSAVRERVSVGDNRQSVSVGENRLGMSVDPSRISRME